MFGSMVDIQSAAAEIRRGIKEEDRKKPQGKNIMSASATQGGHNKREFHEHETKLLVHEIQEPLKLVRLLKITVPY